MKEGVECERLYIIGVWPNVVQQVMAPYKIYARFSVLAFVRMRCIKLLKPYNQK